MFKHARLLGIASLSMLVMVAGCAGPRTVGNSGLFRERMPNPGQYKPVIIPDMRDCVPSKTEPKFTNGGCV